MFENELGLIDGLLLASLILSIRRGGKPMATKTWV